MDWDPFVSQYFGPRTQPTILLASEAPTTSSPGGNEFRGGWVEWILQPLEGAGIFEILYRFRFMKADTDTNG